MKPFHRFLIVLLFLLLSPLINKGKGEWIPPIIIVSIVSFWYYDRWKYPNKFRGKCGYCYTKHGRNQWFIKSLEEDYCYKNGLVFLDKVCLDNWLKENIICEECKTQERYTERTISHKFKRKYYYFCTSYCKNKFKQSNPKLFHKGYHRHSIPSDLRKIIWNRDGGKCVRCGSDRELEYDHIIPVTKGGSTTEKNLELLCSTCNRSKFDKIE